MNISSQDLDNHIKKKCAFSEINFSTNNATGLSKTYFDCFIFVFGVKHKGNIKRQVLSRKMKGKNTKNIQ